MQDVDRGELWYAVQVKARHEKKVAIALQMKGYEQFLPLRRVRHRWSDRMKEVEIPLFAGYVFCRLELDDRLPILTLPSVVRMVGLGRTPVPIADCEIAALKTIVGSGLTAEPWQFTEIGQVIRLIDGPLCGLEGILIGCKEGHRLVVSVSLLKRSVAVEIDHSWAVAADSGKRLQVADGPSRARRPLGPPVPRPA